MRTWRGALIRKHRRSKLEQIINILEVCEREPLIFTWVVYKTGLNADRTKKILKLLVDRGLIKEIPFGYKKLRYKYWTTESGRDLLRKYREFRSFLESKLKGVLKVERHYT